MLRLFDDVLLEILQHLDFQSLISCQATCRKLRRIFIGSTSLQYTAELAACGALDGPHESEHNVSVVERLRRLRLYDDAWRHLRWTKQDAATHLHGLKSPLVDWSVSLSNEALVFLDRNALNASSTAMVFQKLPSTLRGIEEQHRDVVVQRRLSDVMIDSSQDLIVWVETVSEAPVTVRHHLRALSTGDVHPLACDGGYIALKYDPTRSSEAVADICGDYLLLEMFERSRPTAGWEHVVYNWKTGTIVFSGAQGPWGAYQRTRFLDPWHLILDVSASYHDRTVGIKVVQFRDGPSAASIDDDISYTYFFLLPAAVQNISTIIESHMSPWRASSSGGAPGWFHSDPAERLLVVNAYAGVPSGDIAIHVSVRMLLAYVRSHPPPPAPVPWEAWGLECARVVLLPQKMLGFLVHGMRTVAVSDPALQTRPTMTVLDYHPRRVARALARDREARILSVNDIRVEHDPFPVTTSFPCLKTEVPVPDDLARLFSGVGYPTLRVFLCEDGVMVTEVEQIGDSDVVKNAWTFTI